MHHFDTVFPADSVEFCPHPDASNIFVCGTYKLEQDPVIVNVQGDDELYPLLTQVAQQKRTGKCLVFQVKSAKDDH
jgi:diphthine methyl ester acylhydrolase